jgi:hypothetical protein
MTLATSLHEDGDDEDVSGAVGGAGGADEVSKKVARREMWRGGDEGCNARKGQYRERISMIQWTYDVEETFPTLRANGDNNLLALLDL